MTGTLDAQPPLLDLEAVERVLDDAGLGTGPLEASRLGEGHSNITFLLRRGADCWVLRRPPRPPLPPSAHDVLREARVLRLVERTGVHAPRVLLEHPTVETIGVPFYVMELVEGVVPTDTLPAPLDEPAQRRALASALVDELVVVHDVAPPSVSATGRSYLGRQLERFASLWQSSQTREVPDIDRLTALLVSDVPDGGPATLVHGDFRLGNVLVDPGAPLVRAVLDWELWASGDPLADLGYLTATWVDAGWEPGPLALSTITRLPGFPARDELAELYAERSGRSIGRLSWYRAFALWKGAVFLEGNYRRWLEGQSDDHEYCASLADGIPLLARLALAELGR